MFLEEKHLIVHCVDIDCYIDCKINVRRKAPAPSRSFSSHASPLLIRKHPEASSHLIFVILTRFVSRVLTPSTVNQRSIGLVTYNETFVTYL